MIEIVVTGDVVLFAALLVQSDPAAAALHEIISDFHANDGADAREAVRHDADVFRCYGTDYRLQHGASMSVAQRRVMTAIEVCRTAVLGGHLEQCDHCGHQRNAYNSCFMGSLF
jgi:hypothetical protein